MRNIFKPKLLILFTLFFFHNLIYCQLNPNTLLPNVMPSNPQAFQFMKYGEIPVGKYTGIPEISVPIYTIEAKGLQIPLRLSYHSSGFKVNEEAGWTGLGWTLQGIGSITQIVSGTDDFGYFKSRILPDLSSPLFNVPPSAYSSFSSFYTNGCVNATVGMGGCQVGSLAPCVAQVNGYKDSEPDVFKFSMMGYSGSFILDWQNEKFECLSDSNIKIEAPNYVNLNTIPYEFTIVVPDGHRFSFTLKEQGVYIHNQAKSEIYGESFVQPDLRYPDERAFRTYQLREIITNAGEVISFTYNSTNDIVGYPNISKQFYHIQPNTSYDNMFPTPSEANGYRQSDLTCSISLIKQNHSNISSINFDGGQVDFISSPRVDINGAKKLDQIIVKTGSTVIKRFNLNYGYFVGNTFGTNLDNYMQALPISLNANKTFEEFTYRLKLLSIKEENEKGYEFEYFANVSMPKKTSLATDYWGFFNGFLNNSSSFPDFYKFNIYRDKTYLMQFQGNDKSSSLEHTKSAVLKKIIYPTGGCTTFDYELNSFENYKAPIASQGILSSVNISTAPFNISGLSTSKSVIIEGGNTIFTGSAQLNIEGCYPQYPEAYSSCYVNLKHFKKEFIAIIKSVPGYNFYGLDYAINYIKTTNFSLYSQNLDNNTNILYKLYNSPNNQTFNNLLYNLNEGIAVFSVSGGCGTYGSGASSSSSGNLSIASLTLSYRDYKPQTHLVSYGAGLRVNNISTFSDSAVTKLELRKTFEYQGGKLMTPLVFTRKSTYFDTSLLMLPTMGCNIMELKAVKYVFNSSATQELSTSASGSYVGYDSVIEKTVANNYYSGPDIPTNGKIISYYTNNADITGIGDGINMSNQVLLPSIKATMDNGLLQKEEFYDSNNNLVKDNFNQYIMPVCDKGFYGFRFAFMGSNFVDASHCYSGKCTITNVGGYPVKRREKPQLIESIERYYTNGNNISLVKNFWYDSHKQLNKINEILSNQDILETNLSYPYDLSSTSYNTYNGMVARNIISPVIVKSQVINSNLLSQEKHTYKSIATPNPNSYFQSTYAIDEIIVLKDGQFIDPIQHLIFHNYDKYANPTEVSKKDGTRSSYIWGYNGKYPLAKIENASQSTNDNATQGYTIINSNLSNAAVIASNSGTETELITALDGLRNSLPNAMVTTYTYKPLIGVSTMTDPKGDKITYSYDAFGRLQSVKDKDGNVLSENQYNYRPN